MAERLPGSEGRNPPSSNTEITSGQQMELDLAKNFLEVQRREIELRSEELGLRKAEQDHAHEYGLAALREQASDRDKERCHQRSNMRQYLVFACIIIGMFLAFASVAIYRGNEAIVQETLKIAGSFAGGMGAGAFLGYRKARKEQNAPVDGDGAD